MKQQLAEMELFAKNKGKKPEPEKKPKEDAEPPKKQGPAKTVSKESGKSATDKMKEKLQARKDDEEKKRQEQIEKRKKENKRKEEGRGSIHSSQESIQSDKKNQDPKSTAEYNP